MTGQPHDSNQEQEPSAQQAIADFWAKWNQLRPLLEKDLESGEHGEGSNLLSQLINALNLALEWDIVPGHQARNALCLSSAASLALRPLTQQWVQSAPPEDTEWEFHPARIAITPEQVTVGEFSFHPENTAVSIEVDSSTEALHLMISNPAFSKVDETLQLQAVFQMLDDLLGEDNAERWIASVETAPSNARKPIPFLQLPERVEQLTAAATGEQWETEAQYDHELGDSQLLVNRALKRLDHLDLNLSATINIEPPQDQGSQWVETFEKELAEALPGSVLVFARETYADFTAVYAYINPQVIEELRIFCQARRPILYQVTIDADPSWEVYEQMR